MRVILIFLVPLFSIIQSAPLCNFEDNLIDAECIPVFEDPGNDVIIKNKDNSFSASTGQFSFLDVSAEDDALCVACAAGVTVVQRHLHTGSSRDDVFALLKDVCITSNYKPAYVCNELIDLIGDMVITILNNTKNTPREVCSFVENTRCGNGDVPGHQWSVKLPNVPKPPVKPPKPPNPNTPKFKVLHISDTHFDPSYLEGTRDECPLSMCCRIENGMASPNESAAGKWGGWKCDIPEKTLDNMLDHIIDTHTDIDYIVWTGDLPPHETWAQTRNDSLYMLNVTVAKVHKRFPNIPVFPALGNHEASPPHSFPPPNVDQSPSEIKWLYEALVKEWSNFLPESTFSTIEDAGYYVAQVRPGFKIISLNTNFCYFNNWWLILNSTDPADQLAWLVDQLQTAEDKNEKVHVIAHIPPGYYDCLKIWGKNFNEILSRYESTVTAQFYGHTHTDEIEIYYDVTNTTRPVSVGYVGPSVTTFVYVNPGYRVYSVDGDHEESEHQVENFETWVMNLTEANLHDNPVWYKLYSAKEAYNLSSLLPEGWNDFYERLKTDDELLEAYDRHYFKDSPKRQPCGSSCRRTRLCDIRSCIHYPEPDLKSRST